MPINPTALSSPEPDPPQRPVDPVDAERDAAQAADEAPKRTRRTKAQMIADATIPANDEQVDLKDSGTGAKIQRPWLVALEMVRDGKAEFADKAMKYSMLKFDQQKAAGAFAEPTVDQGEPVSSEQQTTQLLVVPPDADVGDEVSIGSDTFRVGHGRVLVDGSRRIAINDEIVRPQRRWIRELGSGPNGPWEAVDPIGGGPVGPGIDALTPQELRDDQQQNAAKSNGHSETPPQPTSLPESAQIERIGPYEWKVGTGILDKIGLPDYSSLQIGPISASRMVIDDGRRTEVTIGKRTAQLPTAVIEVFEEACNIVEYIARYQRGELVSFLESTGALKQPVSS